MEGLVEEMYLLDWKPMIRICNVDFEKIRVLKASQRLNKRMETAGK